MPQVLLPDSRFRSPTAVEDKAGMKDRNLFSAIVTAHGGSGNQTMFTVPKGQSIPRLGTTGSVAAHQSTYTELTTNFTKAGESGSAIGEFGVRGIGLVFEQAAYDSSGAPRTFGMTQLEVNDVLSKCFFQFKIAGTLEIDGPVHAFPASGGAHGAVSTTENSVTIGALTNGWPGALRRIKPVIPVGRTDTVEGILGVAGGATLAYSDTTNGQNSLIWCNLHALCKNDVRG